MKESKLRSGGRAFAAFMAAPTGRGLRAALGVVLIAVGLSLGGVVGGIVVAVGALAVAAGVANFCVVAPLIGAPFRGRDA